MPRMEYVKCIECHREAKLGEFFMTAGCKSCFERITDFAKQEMNGMSDRYNEKKESKLSEMGKTIPINESVTDCVERIDCTLAQELQELWQEGYDEGAMSRDFEVKALQESLETMKKKVNAILTALA